MPSYDLLASAVFNTSANQYSVTGIPGGYTDLVIVINNLRANAQSQLQYTFNDDTSVNYSVALLGSNQNFTVSGYSNNISGGFYLAQTYGVGSASYQTMRIQVGQYTSTLNKTYIAHSQVQNSTGTSFETVLAGGAYPSSSAITSFQINTFSPQGLSSANIYVYGIIDS